MLPFFIVLAVRLDLFRLYIAGEELQDEGNLCNFYSQAPSEANNTGYSHTLGHLRVLAA